MSNTQSTAWPIARDRFVAALEGAGCRVETRYGRTTSQCPAHGSNGLKLAISERRDGAGIVLKCWSQDCAAADIVAAVGLTLRDLFDGDPPAGYVPPPRRKASPFDPIVAVGAEHVAARMSREHALELDPGLRERARAQGDDCPACRQDAAPTTGAPCLTAMNYMPPDRAAAYAAWVKETL